MALSDVFTYFGQMYFDKPQTKPWRFGPWVWATQGHLLVALADDGAEADATPDKYLKAERYLMTDPSSLIDTTFAALRTFAGAVHPADTECPDCLGSGVEGFGDEIKCEHCGQNTRPPCETCGGDGLDALPINYGRIADVLLNRSLLAYGLSLVPHDEAVRVGAFTSITSKNYSAVAVLGASWRIVVMCCVAEAPTAPVFAAMEVTRS